jgi:hypothetical protein
MGTQRGLSNMNILEKSSKDLLYNESNDCGKEFTQLCVVLGLLKLKVSHGWFNNIREGYLICSLSLGVDKIHACHNHCILYRKEYEFNTKCQVCGVSQYKRSYNHVYDDTMKKKIKNKNKTAISPKSVDDKADPNKEDMMKRKIHALVMWYLPVIDRLKHVFSNPRDVKLVRRHSKKCRENDEEIRHPADGTQWKKFDLQ